MTVNSVQRDDEGYVVDPGDWSRELAVALAREETLSLTDEHWVVITFVRDHYAEHAITPDIRHAAKYLATYLGCDKKAGKARLFELFPYGVGLVEIRQVIRVPHVSVHPRSDGLRVGGFQVVPGTAFADPGLRNGEGYGP